MMTASCCSTIMRALTAVALLLSCGCSRNGYSDMSGPPRPPETLPPAAKVASESGQLKARTLVTRAAKARQSGRPTDAVPLYRKALASRIPPGDAAAIRIELANTLIQTGDYAAAMHEADAVIAEAGDRVQENPVAASVLGSSAIRTKAEALSRKEGIPSSDAFNRLVESAPLKERPLLLYVRATKRGEQGRQAEAQTDLVRIINEAPDTEWANLAQGLVDALHYGPLKVNPFVSRPDAAVSIQPSSQAKYEEARTLFERKDDVRFLNAARALLNSLPPTSMEARWLRLSMAETHLRANDLARACTEAGAVLATSRTDSVTETFQGVRAARLIAQVRAREQKITETEILRDLISEAKGYERGLYQYVLADRLQRDGGRSEANSLFRKIAEEYRGTQLAVQAITKVRSGM